MSAIAELEVFHEVRPDEQNARGPTEAVSDLALLSYSFSYMPEKTQ